MQLVNMEKGFVWFPTIACLSKTCPTDSEFHSGALVSVATVVTSQHVLYYCTYYSVSFTCTVHCTYYIYCTLYIQYMFPVSLFPMLRFHLQHLFTLLFTLICSKFTCAFTYHLCSHAFILTKLLSSAQLSVCAPHHLGVTTLDLPLPFL